MTEEPHCPIAGDVPAPAPAEESFSRDSPKPFVAEVLVSAGPRKSAFEYKGSATYAELCEDCAGTCWIGNRLVFWLCDGASNGMVLLPLSEEQGEKTPPPVFGFSARILAQDLGQAFVQHFIRAMPQTLGLTTLHPPASAFADVVQNWGKRFAEIVSRVEDRGARELLLNQLPEVLEDDGRKCSQITWSSTFIGGVLDVQEKTIVIVNLGDCAALVFAKSACRIPPNTSPVRLTARIEHATPLVSLIRLDVSQTVAWRDYKEVNGFALLTDGIDRDLGSLLGKLEKEDLHNLLDLRAELLRKADITWDDKAIVFGRFLGG